MQGAWSPCGIVLKVSGLCCVASHHILYKAGLENVNHLLQQTHNLSWTRYFLLNTVFFLFAVLEASAVSSLGFSPKLSSNICFFLILARVSLQASEKAMETHSSTLAWKIPWTEEPGRLQSMGSWTVRHDWAASLSLFTFMHWRRKWQPTPVFLPGESWGWGAWWAPIYGVSQSRTRLKRLSSSSLQAYQNCDWDKCSVQERGMDGSGK